MQKWHNWCSQTYNSGIRVARLKFRQVINEIKYGWWNMMLQSIVELNRKANVANERKRKKKEVEEGKEGWEKAEEKIENEEKWCKNWNWRKRSQCQAKHHERDTIKHNEYYILPLSVSFTNLYSVFQAFTHFESLEMPPCRTDQNPMRTKRNFIRKAHTNRHTYNHFWYGNSSEIINTKKNLRIFHTIYKLYFVPISTAQSVPQRSQLHTYHFVGNFTIFFPLACNSKSI